MNKNTSSIAVAIAIAGILTLAVLAVAIPHQAFAGSSNSCCDGSGSVNQKANGGDANGGHGGNANGGDART
jgi:hypothetical protein